MDRSFFPTLAAINTLVEGLQKGVLDQCTLLEIAHCICQSRFIVDIEFVVM